MNEIWDFSLNRDSSVPMYRQLGEAIVQLIDEGKCRPNDKLPPIRKLAEKIDVNNITVINAYKYLEMKRVVYARVGSGVYISEITKRDAPEIMNKTDYRLFNSLKPVDDGVINFAGSAASDELFPVEKFKEIFSEVLDRDKASAFAYQDIQGYAPLRESLADYLEQSGIKASADKMMIVSGAQQGIDIISKVLLSAGDVLFVESPTFHGAVGAFSSRAAQIIGIPIDEDGINLVKLEGCLKIYNPKFLYLMTCYQTPTCITYSIKKKRQLLELANQYNMYIIEEDDQSEFNYSQDKNIPLKALDYKNRVIYIKSFSKILMPGLRIGCIVMPKKIMQSVLSAKYATDITTAGLNQRALDLFLRTGEFDTYIAKARAFYQEKYQLTKQAINKYLSKKVRYQDPKGGLYFWLEILNTSKPIEEICTYIAAQGVAVTPGSVYSVNMDGLPFIRIGFANTDKAQIEKGVFTIGKALSDL